MLLGWFWSANSALRSCSKNTATRDPLFFRSWWPFPPLASLLSLGVVFRPLPSDILDKNIRREKKKENEHKNKEMKRGRKWFFAVEIFVDNNKWSKKNKQLEKNKRVKERHWKKRDERWREEKNRDGLMQRRSHGRDQRQLIAHRPDSVNNVTNRSNGQESLLSRTRSSTRVNLEKVFLFCCYRGFLMEKIQMIIFEHTFFGSKCVLVEKEFWTKIHFFFENTRRRW